MTATAAKKELSMSPAAIRSRERRAAAAQTPRQEKNTAIVDQVMAKAKKPAARKQVTATPIKVSVAQKRMVGQFCASIAAGFLPIASYMLAHYESQTNPFMWVLVIAALMFSAPTLVDWSKKWCGSTTKAVGFAVLLEGVMIMSHNQILSLVGLVILVAINSSNAWELFVTKKAD